LLDSLLQEMRIKRIGRVLSKWVVVDPLIFLYCMSFLNYVSKINCYEQRVRHQHSHSTAHEHKFSQEDEEDNDDIVTTQVSTLTANLFAIEMALSALLMVVFGPLSDKYGRKFLIMWNLSFTLLSNVAFVGYNLLQDKFDGYWVFYVTSVITGLSGSIFTFIFLVFSYVGDLSKLEPETTVTRFIMSEGAANLAVVAGSYLYGQIAKAFGDVWVFVVGSAVMLFCLVYCQLRLKPITPKSTKEMAEMSLWRRIIRMLMIPIRKRDVRTLIILFGVASLIQEVVLPLEDILFPLYVYDKWNWKTDNVMNFKSVVFGIRVFGQFAILPFLSKVLRIPVMMIAYMTVVSRCAYFLIMGFCSDWRWLYLGAVVNILAGLQPIIHRAGLSKTLPEDEMGSMFALMELLVALGPTFLSPFCSFVFNATLEYNSGLWTLIPTGLLASQLPFYIMMSFQLKRLNIEI